MLLKPSSSITALGKLIEIVSKNHSMAGSKHILTYIQFTFLNIYSQLHKAKNHVIHIIFGVYLRHELSCKGRVDTLVSRRLPFVIRGKISIA